MVVDDHPTFRKGLTALIKNEAGLTVVAETGDGREAVTLFRRLLPDVVMMDLRLPGYSGAEALLAIKTEFSNGRFIVLTTYDADEDIYRAIQAGAQSVLFKAMPFEEILNAIQAVHAGKSYMPEMVTRLLSERDKRENLSQREMEVLELLVKGCSNKAISIRLGLTEPAIKSRLQGLFSKLGVQDRTEAVIAAVRHGIVHLE